MANKKVLKDIEKVYRSLPNVWHIESDEVKELVSKFRRDLEIMGEEYNRY